MKLSRTAWNNVIIIIVMMMIFIINLMNNQLFPETKSSAINANGEQLILPNHAVILTLAVNEQFLIERIGQSWRIQSKRDVMTISDQALSQMMMAWQQGAGLLQADNIEISGQDGVVVTINIAGEAEAKILTLYPLVDQLLINDKQLNLWISLPQQLYRQLLPVEIYPVKT